MDSSCSPSTPANRDLQSHEQSIVLIRRRRVVEGSCWTCRKRRVKCDVRKPSCTRCLDARKNCSYGTTPPLRWVGDVSSRSCLASLASLKNSSTLSGLGVARWSPPSSQPLEQSESKLYFSNVVLPRFVLNESIERDLDDVLQNETLIGAITAVSQAHYARCSKVDVYDVSTVRKLARLSAIEAFRRCLQQGLQSDSSAQRLFATNILFCILDGMIEPSDEYNSSTCHLRGGWAILHKWPNTPTRMLLQDGLQAHLLSIYATMDLVHALLGGHKPFFQSAIWNMFARLQTWFGRLPAGDKFLGILAAFSDMASLGNVVHLDQSLDSVSLVSKCLPGIEAALSLEGMQDAQGSLGRTNTPSPSPWAIFCSIYIMCGVIYLQRAVRSRPADDARVQIAARHGVAKVIDQNLPAVMRHCIVFPVLIIGSHCTLAQDREAILQVLSPTSSYLSFGNMQLMADFLRETWAREQTNQTWWELFAPLSEKAFLF
ncbi:Zn(2)-C6 fungal-type DNA-binding domain protein [Metarhizium album ARSEF 1941]|uniref:Zn(2)-C6 fungal-type DNA-binding domain protein n=1 Tax=Metarhizium album (strain ARSEF 1941) TaxID=1081103 RepID=A0A0B2X027_METAS|nr:Zn(2)-C6 fungal-type DNA-binding domain protein [Metarhizium album ARSEF 1941]KHN98440.1 Zn(2)-C6 fungal-type DNA-binding domain protein [Metarhizium album ARSEF 1941]